MASSSELIRKRSEYYAFKENINILKEQIKKSLSALTIATNKVSEVYTIDNEEGDNYKLKKLRDQLQEQYNILISRTIPAIEYKISRLSTEIENAIAEEIARARL